MESAPLNDASTLLLPGNSEAICRSLSVQNLSKCKAAQTLFHPTRPTLLDMCLFAVQRVVEFAPGDNASTLPLAEKHLLVASEDVLSRISPNATLSSLLSITLERFCWICCKVRLRKGEHSWTVNLAARFLPRASHDIMHECTQRSL